MIHVHVQRHVNSPIDDVFERLSDIDRYRTWLPRSAIYIESRLATKTDELSVGTVFYDESTLGTLQGEVTAYQPPTHIAFRQQLESSGKVVFESRPEYRLESTDAGTLVRHSGAAELTWPLSLAAPMVWLLAQYERRRVVRALQASLE